MHRFAEDNSQSMEVEVLETVERVFFFKHIPDYWARYGEVEPATECGRRGVGNVVACGSDAVC